jgi:hypothetical protein
VKAILGRAADMGGYSDLRPWEPATPPTTWRPGPRDPDPWPRALPGRGQSRGRRRHAHTSPRPDTRDHRERRPSPYCNAFAHNTRLNEVRRRSDTRDTPYYTHNHTDRGPGGGPRTVSGGTTGPSTGRRYDHLASPGRPRQGRFCNPTDRLPPTLRLRGSPARPDGALRSTFESMRATTATGDYPETERTCSVRFNPVPSPLGDGYHAASESATHRQRTCWPR